MRCRECGHSNDENARFCSYCGARLSNGGDTVVYDYDFQDSLKKEEFRKVEIPDGRYDIDRDVRVVPVKTRFIEENTSKERYQADEYSENDPEYETEYDETDYSYPSEPVIEKKYNTQDQRKVKDSGKKWKMTNSVDTDDDILDRDRVKPIGRSRGSRMFRRIFLILLLGIIAASSFLILNFLSASKDTNEKAEKLKSAAGREYSEKEYLSIAEDFLEVSGKQAKAFESLSGKTGRYGLIDEIYSRVGNEYVRQALIFAVGMGDFNLMVNQDRLSIGYYNYLFGHIYDQNLAEAVSSVLHYEDALFNTSVEGNFGSSSGYDENIKAYRDSIATLKDAVKSFSDSLEE